MSQEHKFCAEVYHRLYNKIDHAKPILFCLDGEATCSGFATKQTIPDLCFTFLSSDRQLRVEAKILERRRVELQPSQRSAWCSSGMGEAKPHLWIGADAALTRFWVWDHEPFAAKIELHKTSKGPLLVFPDGQPPTEYTIEGLTQRILAWAEEHGFKPKEQSEHE